VHLVRKPSSCVQSILLRGEVIAILLRGEVTTDERPLRIAGFSVYGSNALASTVS